MPVARSGIGGDIWNAICDYPGCDKRLQLLAHGQEQAIKWASQLYSWMWCDCPPGVLSAYCPNHKYRWCWSRVPDQTGMTLKNGRWVKLHCINGEWVDLSLHKLEEEMGCDRTYKVGFTCGACKSESVLDVPKGVKPIDFRRTGRCPHCECIGTLVDVPWAKVPVEPCPPPPVEAPKSRLPKLMQRWSELAPEELRRDRPGTWWRVNLPVVDAETVLMDSGRMTPYDQTLILGAVLRAVEKRDWTMTLYSTRPCAAGRWESHIWLKGKTPWANLDGDGHGHSDIPAEAALVAYVELLEKVKGDC